MTDSPTPANPPEDTPATRPPAVMSRARLPRSALVFVAVSAGLTLLVCLLVAARALTLGVADEWVWKYHQGSGRGLANEMGLPLGLFVVFLVLVRYLATSKRALAGWDRELLAVALLVVSAFLFQLASGSIYAGLGQDILAVTQESVGGYFDLSEEIVSPRAFLEGFPRLLATRTPVGHLNTHPPGNTMYFYLLRRTFEDFPDLARRVSALETPTMRGPEGAFAIAQTQRQVVWSYAERATAFVGALLLRLAAALIVVPLYLLGRWSLGKSQAVYLAALGVSIPAVVVFLPGFDAVYGTAAAAVAALCVGALVWRSRVLAFLAGLVLYGSMVFTPVLTVVVFSVLVWYVVARGSDWGKRLARRPGQPELKALAGVGLLGFAVPLATAWFFLHFDAISTWWQCLASNARFNRLTGRSYLPWVLYNPVDFLAFLGVGLSSLLVVAVAGLVRGVRNWRQSSPLALGLGVYVLVLLLLNLSGANAGEVARLWMFLMPGAALLALPALERFGPAGNWVILVVLLCQALQAFLFKLYLNVLFIT